MSEASPSPSPSPSSEERVIDTRALHGLAHPLRIRLWDELAAHGPATATALARRVGESSGSTSYHLRQLAKHGFIEEDPERGTGRERWWRAVSGTSRLPVHEMRKSPATRAALQLVLGEFRKQRQLHLEHWWATNDDWPDEWIQASTSSTSHLRLTPADLRAMKNEINDIVVAWAARTEDRTHADYVHTGDEPLADVAVLVDAFPMGEPEEVHDGR
jgi:DNA-binding transcriptional ArsR family regulator